MLARLPSDAVRSVPPRAVRLPDYRRRAITLDIAAVMRVAEPTPFAAEGPSRAGIRSGLCLDGWRWHAADAAAAEIVAAALALVGARRPTWAEGQPGHVVDGAWRVERERCVRCFKPLPEGHRLYCSRLCGRAQRQDEATHRRCDEIDISHRARRAAWSARQAPRACGWCAGAFQPKERKQKFCCVACSRLALGGPVTPHRRLTSDAA